MSPPAGLARARMNSAKSGVLMRGDCSAFPNAAHSDALVHCGKEAAPSALEIPNPVIVVEVLSPSTQRVDTSKKVAGYFRLPSVAHYIIVDLELRLMLHYTRSAADTILTHIVREGTIALDPPGLELAVADVWGGAQGSVL